MQTFKPYYTSLEIVGRGHKVHGPTAIVDVFIVWVATSVAVSLKVVGVAVLDAYGCVIKLPRQVVLRHAIHRPDDTTLPANIVAVKTLHHLVACGVIVAVTVMTDAVQSMGVQGGCVLRFPQKHASDCVARTVFLWLVFQGIAQPIAPADAVLVMSLCPSRRSWMSTL